MSLVKVESFVYYEHADVEYVLPHRHETYELVYYLSGKGEVNYLGEKHDYAADTVSIVEPQTKHDEASDAPTNVYIVLFSVSPKLRLGNLFLPLKADAAAEVKAELDRVYAEYGSKRPYARQMVNALMELALLRLLREYGDNGKSPAFLSDCAATAKQYIKEHSGENLDFVRLAQSLGYSYHRFRHIFKEVTGITPSGYLLEQRLSRAKELLETTELPVAEIARQTGFSSQQYFINFFRAHVGASPARYRHIFKIDNPIGVYRFK